MDTVEALAGTRSTKMVLRRSSPTPAATSDAASSSRPSWRSIAFKTLYSEHYDRVVLAVRLFGVPERDSSDVAQEVFVRVHASLPRFDRSRPLRPWLRVIAYRAARSYLRGGHRRLTLLGGDDRVEAVATTPSPEREAEIEERRRLLAEVLQDLDDDQREVFLLHRVDEITIPEIAKMIGVAENTVRSRLHRARVKFDLALRRRRIDEDENSAIFPLLHPTMLLDAVREHGGTHAKKSFLSRAIEVAGLTLILALGPEPSADPGSNKPTPGYRAALAASQPEAEATIEAEPVETASDPRSMATTPTLSMAAKSEATPAQGPRKPTMVEPGIQDPSAILRAEGAIVARAREAMNSGRYDLALRELRRHEHVFPNGRLAEQRRALMSIVNTHVKTTGGRPR